MKHLRCYKLAVQFYRQAKGVRLARHLQTQLERAASSIALNLSEGSGKSTNRDRRKFFTIAMGSTRECQAIVDLEPHRFSGQQKELLDHLAASVYRLVRNAPS